MNKMFKKGSKGFTLVEILIVVVILGILASVVVPRFLTTSAAAKISSCDANKANINTQVEMWKFNTGSYPAADLSDIGADTNYFPDGIPVCPVDGTAYALETLTGKYRVDGHSH